MQPIRGSSVALDAPAYKNLLASRQCISGGNDFIERTVIQAAGVILQNHLDAIDQVPSGGVARHRSRLASQKFAPDLVASSCTTDNGGYVRRTPDASAPGATGATGARYFRVWTSRVRRSALNSRPKTTRKTPIRAAGSALPATLVCAAGGSDLRIPGRRERPTLPLNPSWIGGSPSDVTP